MGPQWDDTHLVRAYEEAISNYRHHKAGGGAKVGLPPPPTPAREVIERNRFCARRKRPHVAASPSRGFYAAVPSRGARPCHLIL